ncbi:unnamed protein product, partial [Rotaria sordida]
MIEKCKRCSPLLEKSVNFSGIGSSGEDENDHHMQGKQHSSSTIRIQSNSFLMDTQPKNNLSSRQRINIPRPLWSPRPLPAIITTNQQLVEQQKSTKKKKKKKRRKRCHGQRKLRRFKKKWHRRGLNEEEIQKLIDQYQKAKNEMAISNIKKDEIGET